MNFLKNKYSREEAYEVTDYPYGFRLRTSLFIWIERNKRGYRIVRQTINPKTWRENKPKKSVYYSYARLFKNEDWHIKTYVFDLYSVQGFLKAQRLNVFEEEDKELEKQLGEAQRIMTIKWLAIYWGYEFEKIKDFDLLDLDKLDQKEKAGDVAYINTFKTEEGKQEGYSPFKTTSYVIG